MPEKCGSRFSKRRVLWKISLRKTKPEAAALIACRNELKRFRKALESCNLKCCMRCRSCESNIVGHCAEREEREKACLKRNKAARRHSVASCDAVARKQMRFRLEIIRIGKEAVRGRKRSLNKFGNKCN